MLDLKFVKTNLDLVKNGMERRRAKINFTALLDNDEKRKKLLLEIESLRHKRNTVSDDIAKIKKSGGNADDVIKEMRTVSETIKDLDKELTIVQGAINDF